MRPVTLIRVECFVDGFQVKQGRVRRDEVTFFVPGMMFRHDLAGTVVVGEMSLTIASVFSNLNRGIVESRIPRSISGLRVRATSVSSVIRLMSLTTTISNIVEEKLALSSL
jgi:hypothetical protein